MSFGARQRSLSSPRRRGPITPDAWERVGVRGPGPSIGRNPSPGSHLSMRSDLSHKGRGNARSRVRRFDFQTAKTPNVIASEAKQSMARQNRRVDCFVASLLAMTTRYESTIPRRDAPESCMSLSPNRGRGECRVPNAPAASRAKCKKHTSVVTTGPPDLPGIPARNGFNGFLRALPGDRACLSPSSAEMASANLTPASRRQNHTTSPSAPAPFVKLCCRVHRIPPRVDDVAQRPSFGTGRREF